MVRRSLIVSSAFAAITDDEHYVKLIGLEKLVKGSEHKQEIVAGNLAGFLKTSKRTLLCESEP